MSRVQPSCAAEPTVNRNLLLDALRRLARRSRAHSQLLTRYRRQIAGDTELRQLEMLGVAS